MHTITDALSHHADRPPKRQFPDHVLQHDEYEVICDGCSKHFTAFQIPPQGDDPGCWVETDCPVCGSSEWEPMG